MNEPKTKVLKVFHLDTSRFLIINKYDFLYAVNSNFCSKTHHLTSSHVQYIRHRQTDDRQTDAIL